MAEDTVAAVRRFNRFYTRAIGVLDKSYLGTAFTLAEGRVLFEIAKSDGITAKTIGEITGLDAGYLSRITGRFEREGVVARARSASDGRSAILRLTDHGAAVFAPLDIRSAGLVERLIAGLSGPDRAALTGAMARVEALLDAPTGAGPAILRPHRPGDMGWVTERHALAYGQEYGWGPGIEALTARVCADFLEHLDPAKERCWIAERGGERVGSVFLVKDEATDTARLRLLLVEPGGRGLGLGKRLVAECIDFARSAGYQAIVLWTHAVLTAARGIYAQAGFEITETWTHADFGHDEIAETWKLAL